MMKNTLILALSATVLASCASHSPELFTPPADARAYQGDTQQLVAEGKRLWSDTSLSSNGLSCSSCHYDETSQFNPTFGEPYPHKVAMASRNGLGEITAAQMVQLCMTVPMAAQPLPWSSKELAALSSYITEELQDKYRAKTAK